MSKSVLALIFVVAALIGGGVLLSRNSPEPNSPHSVISTLEAAKKQEKQFTEKSKSAEPADLPVPSSSGPWPKIMAEEISYAFGTMQVGSKKTHSFQITNAGDADLILKAGSTTCKCTKFGFGSEEDSTKDAVLKPGESTMLVMSWKAGETPDRSFRHGGDLHTNDPQTTTLKFTVEGAIEMPFEVQPQIWSVGTVYTDQPGKMRAAVGSKVFESLKIRSIETKSELVRVVPSLMTPEAKAEGGYLSGYTFEVEVAGDIPPGLFRDEIRIQLAETPDPIVIAVTARKQGVFRLQQMPGTVFNHDNLQLQLGSFPAAEGRQAKLLLIVDEKDMSEPFRLVETTADPPFVTAEIEPIGTPSGSVHRYVLMISVPRSRPHVQRTSTNPGFVEISTNHPSGESMRLGLLLYSN